MAKRRGWQALAYIAAAVFFLAFLIDQLAFSTRLLTPVGLGFRLPVIALGIAIGIAIGIALGMAMAVLIVRASRGLAILAPLLFGLLFGMLSVPLSERAAELWRFSGAKPEGQRVQYAITDIGTGRGGPYALVDDRYRNRDTIELRLPISKADYAAVEAPRQTGRRYCLVLLIERSGDAVRLHVPPRPRPSRAGKRTITPCMTGPAAYASAKQSAAN